MSSIGDQHAPPAPSSSPEPGHRLAIAIALGAGLLVLVLIVPSIRHLFALLFSGDVWTALIGVGLLVLLAGMFIAGLLGDRSRGARRFGLLLMAIGPICVIAALIGSGWVVDAFEWVRNAISDLHGS